MMCFYDLETTGLPNPARKDLPGIIQIAAALYDENGQEIDTYETKINPEIKKIEWQEGAIRTTGVGPDDVGKDWPTFFEVFPEFADFVARATVLGGYNILHFDDDVLYNNLVKYGFEKHFPWPRHRVDVMDLSKAYHNQKGKRGNKRPKLTEIYAEIFGEEMEGAHDAMVDVRGVARVGFEIGKDVIARLLLQDEDRKSKPKHGCKECRYTGCIPLTVNSEGQFDFTPCPHCS